MTTRSIPRPLVSTEPHTFADVWLWPSRLTLQAPAVAVIWQLLLARCWHVSLNSFEPLALAMAVWLIYVADHLIDTVCPIASSWEPPRKRFCRRHWSKFLGCSILVGAALAVSAFYFLPPAVARGGWLLSLGVAFYFVVIHIAPQNWRRSWPREIFVAVFFSVGTFGVTSMASRYSLTHFLPPAFLFTLLCWMNCSLIESWEWRTTGASAVNRPNVAALWIADRLSMLGVLIALLSGALAAFGLQPALFAFAVCLSGLTLSILGIYRSSIRLRFISPAADLALCSPIAVLLLSRSLLLSS